MKITVWQENGSALEPTYLKRAKQLVKTGRAKWINDTTICLLTKNKEDGNMDYTSNGASKRDTFEEPPYTVVSGHIDEELYKMAKKRVQARAALLTHCAAYATVNIFLFFIALNSREFWNFFVLGGWGIGLACHIVSYFFSATPETIHKEYLKLKNKFY